MLAKMIDHTLLKPDATREQIMQLCREAVECGFATVCINPYWVNLAATSLKGTEVGITTVIGFPLGASTTAVKAAETADALANGATEIDMVMNVGAAKSGDWEAVRQDIAKVVEAASGKAIVKVILETGLLDHEEKRIACQASKKAGAHYVKTSTGFGPGGATVEDIALMRGEVGREMGVKASGGVRDYETAMAMVEAGANRIGASAGVAIIGGGKGKGDY